MAPWLRIRTPLDMDNRFVEPLAVEAHSAPASHPQLAALPFGRHFLLLAPLAVAPARRRLEGRSEVGGRCKGGPHSDDDVPLREVTPAHPRGVAANFDHVAHIAKILAHRL